MYKDYDYFLRFLTLSDKLKVCKWSQTTEKGILSEVREL